MRLQQAGRTANAALGLPLVVKFGTVASWQVW
jgi:hypothetical protein